MNHQQDPTSVSIEKGTYRHSKSGNLYEAIGVALETETSEMMVIYRPLYESEFELFARPYVMFMEKVTINGREVPRFERMSDE